MNELDALLENYFKKYSEPLELYELDLALGEAGAIKFIKESKGREIFYSPPVKGAKDDIGSFKF